MAHQEWNAAIKDMFSRISKRYDIMNTIMSFGMDRVWRKRVVELASVPFGGAILDVGAGTGRITIEAAFRYPWAKVYAADITPEMMALGIKDSPGNVTWVQADALHLPFKEAVFDAVTSGFLLRNVPDARKALAEQFRVLKPGGRVVCLDAGPPDVHVLEPVVKFYLDKIIPCIGRLVTGDEKAYKYLPESAQNFMDARGIAGTMIEAGFTDPICERFMFGTINLVHARRPS